MKKSILGDDRSNSIRYNEFFAFSCQEKQNMETFHLSKIKFRKILDQILLGIPQLNQSRLPWFHLSVAQKRLRMSSTKNIVSNFWNRSLFRDWSIDWLVGCCPVVSAKHAKSSFFEQNYATRNNFRQQRQRTLIERARTKIIIQNTPRSQSPESINPR